MHHRRVFSFWILSCVLVWGSAAGAADADARRALAMQLISHADVQADQQSTRQVLTHLTARRLFHGLRQGEDWNGDHPLWRRYFAEFLRDYRALVDQWLGDVTTQQVDRLAGALDEEALARVVAFRTGPELVAVFSQLRSAGMSAATALWIPDVMKNPHYYARTEQEQARQLQEKILAPDARMVSLLEKMAGQLDDVQTPAYAAYSRVVRETVLGRVENFPALPEARGALTSLLLSWHARLDPGAP